MNNTLPWATYIRVSTDDQAEEGASIPAQRASCEAYAKARGWGVPPELVLVDDGYTGRNAKRPGFQRLLDLLRTRQVQGVIAWKLKRLARSTRIVADLLDLLAETRTELACVAESWDTTTPMGRAMVGVGAIFAQLESEDNGVQTSAAMQHLRKNGYWTGGAVPAGCRVVPADGGKRRKLELGEHADTVRQAWGWILAGASLREVGQRLHQAGVPCSSRGEAKAKPWTGVQVRNLLLSPQVVGLLVDAPTQLAVRHRLSTRTSPVRRGSGKPGVKAETPSPLAGILSCPVCESAMVQVTATGHGGRYRYFRCTGRIKGRCAQKDVRCEPVEAAVLAAVAEACQLGGEYPRQLLAELEAARAELAKAKDERAALQSQRDQLSARISDLVLRQQIGAPGWDEAMRHVGAELERVDARLAVLRGVIGAGESDQLSVDLVLADIASHAARLPTLPVAEQARTLRLMLDRARLDGEYVVLRLYRPSNKGEPARGDRRVRTKALEWLPGAHGLRTIEVRVNRRSCASTAPGRP